MNFHECDASGWGDRDFEINMARTIQHPIIEFTKTTSNSDLQLVDTPTFQIMRVRTYALNIKI
jgi:hypothetical protein